MASVTAYISIRIEWDGMEIGVTAKDDQEDTKIYDVNDLLTDCYERASFAVKGKLRDQDEPER